MDTVPSQVSVVFTYEVTLQRMYKRSRMANSSGDSRSMRAWNADVHFVSLPRQSVTWSESCSAGVGLNEALKFQSSMGPTEASSIV